MPALPVGMASVHIQCPLNLGSDCVSVFFEELTYDKSSVTNLLFFIHKSPLFGLCACVSNENSTWIVLRSAAGAYSTDTDSINHPHSSELNACWHNKLLENYSLRDLNISITWLVDGANAELLSTSSVRRKVSVHFGKFCLLTWLILNWQ